MNLHTAIAFALMWLVMSIEPASASPVTAENAQWVTDLGHAHMVWHAAARVCACGVGFGGVVAFGVGAWIKRRAFNAARNGGCLRKMESGRRAWRAVSAAAVIAPAAAFAAISWALDGALHWECSRGPEIDSACMRSWQLVSAAAAALVGVGLGIAGRKVFGGSATKRRRRTARSTLSTQD